MKYGLYRGSYRTVEVDRIPTLKDDRTVGAMMAILFGMKEFLTIPETWAVTNQRAFWGPEHFPTHR